MNLQSMVFGAPEELTQFVNASTITIVAIVPNSSGQYVLFYTA